MDNSSDDEIELLNPPIGDEKELTGDLFENEPSVNPLLFLRQGSSDVVSPGSLHALQTAFSSLTQKLNDKTKKYNELYQKNKLMQKALLDMSQQDHMKPGRGMDDMCQLEPSIVHAAGAGCSSEDESVIAEQRARQGYISHLEREVLRNTNLIARFTSENQRLKKTLDERDREKKGLVQENDSLKTELDRFMCNNEDEVRERHKRIDELENLKQQLFQEKIILQDRIQTLERTNSTKDIEIGNLKSKLTSAENEMGKLTMQCIELNRNDHEKEEELSRLKAQCNQYEIEADINRKRKVTEGMDDVDGDTDNALIKAMDMISSQRKEMSKLVIQVQQQQSIIKELLPANYGTGVNLGNKVRSAISDSEQRVLPQGSSMHIYQDEQPPVNNYNGLLITKPPPSVKQEHNSSHLQREISPLTRRQSDRGDYRSPVRQTFSTSPRVRETFITTGHTNIPEMLANEDSVSRRSPGSNIIDGSVSGPRLSPCLSPRSHRGSPQPQPQPQPVYMNINPNPASPRDDRQPQRQNLSPRSRMEHSQPSDAVTSVYQTASVVNNGARPKQSFYPTDMNIEQQGHVTGSKRLPDRMTQSAILLRDNSSTDNSAMSRSFMGSNLTLETKEPSPPRRQEVYTFPQPEDNEQAETNRDHLYKNDVRQSDIGPDYENICNIMSHSSRRPIEEHEDSEDTHYIRDVINIGTGQERNDDVSQIREANVREGSEVSQLKICPVCNLEYSRLSMDQFQQHVFECFDNGEESNTIQPSMVATEDDRNCPMCGEVFPLTIPQEAFEQHVLGHFGDGQTGERFEFVHSNS